MKKIISALIAASMLGVSAMPIMAEEDVVSVIVDNEEVLFDQTPVIVDGSTLVPIRAVFEKAGAEVKWNQETLTATLTRGNYTVDITVGDNVLYKNGTQIALAKPAQIINDRVLIPVRAIGEAMDFDVNWDGYHSRVVVSTDGTEYRPYVARRVGFREMSEAAKYYSTSSFAWIDMDADGDGSDDTVSFTSTLDTSSAETPLLMINGDDFSNQLRFLPSIYSFALIDLDKTDNTREIVITANGDCLSAYFFRYDGKSLVPIMNKESRACVQYVSKLFFDELSYVVSDYEGFCWTDIMLTGSIYRYIDGSIVQYYVNNASRMLPRKLVHTYNDNMVYKVYITDKFNKGSYKTMQADDIREAAAFTDFVVKDMYIDDYTPQYVEFFVTLPDGTNMVIVPYSS